MRYTRGMIGTWNMVDTEEHVTIIRDNKYDNYVATGTKMWQVHV
jgi:hypothetical protein